MPCGINFLSSSAGGRNSGCNCRSPIVSSGFGSPVFGRNGERLCASQKPETVMAWHRKGFSLDWSGTSRPRQGRPPVSSEAQNLIRRMSVASPCWGAPIHGELGKLGIKVAETAVAKNDAIALATQTQNRCQDHAENGCIFGCINLCRGAQFHPNRKVYADSKRLIPSNRGGAG